MRLPGLVVGGRRGTHLTGHASGRYESGLRADPSRVHRRNVMVSAAVVVGLQRGPAGRALHGHQLGRRNGDQTVAAVRACWKHGNFSVTSARTFRTVAEGDATRAPTHGR